MKKLALIPLFALFCGAVAQTYPVQDFNNKPVPKFTLVTTGGKTLTPASLKGKVYLIDFWATWCSPCKAAMPTMQKLHDKYKSKGFQVIGANILESRDKANQAAKFLQTNKYTYPFTKNTDAAEKFAETLKVQGIPTMLLVDKQGVIRHVKVGFKPAEVAEIDKKIASLLK